jgi:(E)-4-hydroxy-3-methylbut-2-enyl-diphosphate synthase
VTYSAVGERRKSRGVQVGNVTVGGGAPVVVQSMTNTDTMDVEGTARQVADLARAGSELVRITVDRAESAAAVPIIRDRSTRWASTCRWSATSTISATRCSTKHPACAEALAKYRINPGNVGFGEKQDRNFSMMIEAAARNDKPVRIGVNWGSLDQAMLTKLMDENAKLAEPKDARLVMHEALVQSGIHSATRAEELGLPGDKIVISAKVLGGPGSHRGLSRARPPLRLRAASGPHRGRHGLEGHRRLDRRACRAAAGGHRRHHPHLAHPRARRRPHQAKCSSRRRSCRPWVCAAFMPMVIACPGCGRTTSTVFQELAGDIQAYLRERHAQWQRRVSGLRDAASSPSWAASSTGPANPSTPTSASRSPAPAKSRRQEGDRCAPIFIDGKKAMTLRGERRRCGPWSRASPPRPT